MPALNDATNKVRAREHLSRAVTRARVVTVARRRRGTRDGWMRARPTARPRRSPDARDDETRATTTTTTRDGARTRLTDEPTRVVRVRARAGQSLDVEVHAGAIEEKLGRVGGRRGAAAAVERTVDEPEIGGFGRAVV